MFSPPVPEAFPHIFRMQCQKSTDFTGVSQDLVRLNTRSWTHPCRTRRKTQGVLWKIALLYHIRILSLPQGFIRILFGNYTFHPFFVPNADVLPVSCRIQNFDFSFSHHFCVVYRSPAEVTPPFFISYLQALDICLLYTKFQAKNLGGFNVYKFEWLVPSPDKSIMGTKPNNSLWSTNYPNWLTSQHAHPADPASAFILLILSSLPSVQIFPFFPPLAHRTIFLPHSPSTSLAVTLYFKTHFGSKIQPTGDFRDFLVSYPWNSRWSTSGFLTSVFSFTNTTVW